MFPSCFYKSCMCKYLSDFFHPIILSQVFLCSFINFGVIVFNGYRISLEGLYIIYFTILPPLWEYLGCFQFFTEQLFDDYFSAYGFFYISGYFLRLASQKEIIESKFMNIFMASKYLLKKVGVPFHEVHKHKRGNVASKKIPVTHVCKNMGKELLQ